MIKRELINQSIDYIIQHFDENLSIDIGMDYGYSSSNYSSAFRKHHHVTPVEFRKSTNATGMTNPFYPEGLSGFDAFEDYENKIKIQVLSDFLVICERMIGNYIEIKEKWFVFLDQYKDYIKADTILMERFYDDPTITNMNSCLCDLCMTTDELCGLNNVTAVQGGKFATYRFDGKIQDIFCTIQGIFSIWLPASAYEMDKRYGLNIYREIDRENKCVIMDICIPIK